MHVLEHGVHRAPKHDSGHLRNSKTAATVAAQSESYEAFLTGCHPRTPSCSPLLPPFLLLSFVSVVLSIYHNVLIYFLTRR
jgi:hypothetical protein